MITELPKPLSTVSIFKRGLEISISRHFRLSEFECKCGKCPVTIACAKQVSLLEELRSLINKPIQILSAYRCPEHNKKVGGAQFSQHMLGNATDIVVHGLSVDALWDMCVNLEFDGIGRYDNFVHVDSRGWIARWDMRRKK